MTRLRAHIKNQKQKTVIFTDLFDTLLHRTVHPNYTLKLWGKFMVRELGLTVEVDTLYSIRKEALKFLGKRQRLKNIEVDYTVVIEEVYQRLVNCNFISDISFDLFKATFEKSDYVAETSVQFKNEALVNELIDLKVKGYEIYLISDFYLSEKIILQILDFHGITEIFLDVFISCSLGKSKEKGQLYRYVLDKTGVNPKDVVMMGDNKRSDVENAEKHGISGIHLKHRSHKDRNRKNLFGSDSHAFKKVCRQVERTCHHSPHPFSEYTLHFYFFIERLYIRAKTDGVQNLFFLAREGHFLKRLFDIYQDMNRFTDAAKINTHYFMMSRHSALQISLKPLHEENFKAFKGSLGQMSVLDFMNGLRFPDNITRQITDDMGEISTTVFRKFFKSEVFNELKKNDNFVKLYENHRKIQKIAFEDYLKSFEVAFEQEGMHLVDVGWGGTMQENLYRYWNTEIPVTGYYLGLKKVYDIQPKTKRYGLNFSIYPSRNHCDEVLMANGQLYEQLLAAPHGSTVGYTNDSDSSFALCYHEENEKKVYDTLIQPVQEYMLGQFKILFEKLRPIDYQQDLSQIYLTNLALRSGILGKRENAAFMDQLSKGFYQNVGQNKVGVAYSPKSIKESKLALFAGFLKSPEKLFRYLVKIKPFMLSKGMYWMSFPVNLAYYYMRFNFWFKRKWLGKGLAS